MTRAARLAVAFALLLLAGCQLQPLHGVAGGAGPRALSGIEVGPINDRAGLVMRERLLLRLAPHGDGAAPGYRLDVVLDDRIEGFGVRGDNVVIRERRTLRARYRLVELASGATIIDRTVGSDAGIDVVSSEYAVVAAEETALERLAERLADDIVARLALDLRARAP